MQLASSEASDRLGVKLVLDGSDPLSPTNLERQNYALREQVTDPTSHARGAQRRRARVCLWSPTSRGARALPPRARV